MDENGVLTVAFRGRFQECLQDFIRRLALKIPKLSVGSGKAKRTIAEFCGVGSQAVKCWLAQKNLPQGLSLLKFMCWLDMMSYRVVELEEMATSRRGFAELIAFGVISSEQAATMVGYTRVANLFQVLRGDFGTSQEKDQKMYEIWRSHREQLQHCKEEATQRYRIDLDVKKPGIVIDRGPDLSSADNVRTQKVEVPGPNLTLRTHQATISAIDVLLMLLDEDSIEEFSQSTLAINLASKQKILRLSALMSTLNYKMSTLSPERELTSGT